jgi:hypothetical protein
MTEIGIRNIEFAKHVVQLYGLAPAGEVSAGDPSSLSYAIAFLEFFEHRRHIARRPEIGNLRAG